MEERIMKTDIVSMYGWQSGDPMPAPIQNNVMPTVIVKTSRGERAFDITSLMLEQRVVFLTGQVEDYMANNIIQQLLYLDQQNHDDINMYINSPGGVVTSGMGIYDTMNFIKSDVSTLCIGQAASMGAFLLSAGAPGKRLSLPESRIMIHQPLGGAQGQATDMEIQVAEINRIKNRLSSVMADNSGITLDEILPQMERDNFLSAQESVDFGKTGLIDKVVPVVPSTK
jgi:ATP-dependent Clp protease protease subunit